MIATEIVEADARHTVTGLPGGDGQRAQIRVIAPALNSRLRHWLSDEDEARARARLRLALSLDSLCSAGIEADGRMGDADPLQAIDDALFEFRAGEIVIVMRSGLHSRWATRDLVERTSDRFGQAVLQIVVEPSANGRTRPGRGRNRSVRRAASAAMSLASLNATGSLACGHVEANG